MGFSISWIALKDQTPDQAAALFGLTRTSETTDFPEGKISGAQLPGWYLLWMKGCDHKFIAEPNLRSISSGRELVAASIEEHVMFASAESWVDGKQQWKVSHQSEDELNDVVATGNLPPQFTTIRADMLRLNAEDVDTDYLFEIPVGLAESIFGFRYDSTPNASFEKLTLPQGEGSSGFFKNLFGKK